MIRRKAIRAAIWTLLIPLLVAVGLNTMSLGMVSIPIMGTAFVDGWGNMPFDGGIWGAAGGDVGVMASHGPIWDNRRARMLSDLLSCHLHKGMSERDIEKLIGRSSSGGGGMGNSAETYPLLAFPRPDQQIVARFFFGSGDPCLVLNYHGVAPRLVGWEIK